MRERRDGSRASRAFLASLTSFVCQSRPVVCSVVPFMSSTRQRNKDGGHHGTWTTRRRNEGFDDKREARAGASVGWRGRRDEARWAVLVSGTQRIQQIEFSTGVRMSYYGRLSQTSFLSVCAGHPSSRVRLCMGYHRRLGQKSSVCWCLLSRP